jgi:tetratricopeptide (TPR) repeat protein
LYSRIVTRRRRSTSRQRSIEIHETESRTDAGLTEGLDASRWPDRAAWLALALYAAALLYVQLALHTTPGYGVETDLLTDSIPAARGMRAGKLLAEHLEFRGIGYPMLLALGGALVRDDFLAARILDVLAAIGAGAGVYLLARRVVGAGLGVLVMVGVLLDPAFVMAAVECGTDLPGLALAIGSTVLLLSLSSDRARFGAGLLAAVAFVTRYNNAFLFVAAGIVLLIRRASRREIVGYVAGAAIPLGAWIVAGLAMGASPFHNRNYINVAYEMYGRGAGFEEFVGQSSDRFRSLADVARFDPARFFSRLGANVATRWLRDARDLLPLWLGVLAMPGLVLGRSRDRDVLRDARVHFLLCYLLLAPVFYAPRFALYLLPFYMIGAALLAVTAWPFGRPAPATWTRVRMALFAVLVSVSIVPAWMRVRTALGEAPREVREAGRVLRTMGRPGDRVVARKPHVAYFADMDFVAMPIAYDLTDLVRTAQRNHARFLFFSAIERSMRPQFAVLGDSAVTLPGLAPVGYRTLGGGRFFALYRVTYEPVDAERMRPALIAVLGRTIREHPEREDAYVLLADQAVQAGRPDEALPLLERAERLAPADPMLFRVRSVALFRMGAFEPAADAIARTIALGAATSWDHAHLGYLRLAQERFAEARRELEAAVALEPARTEYLAGLGIAQFHTGDAAVAVTMLEKALAAAPAHRDARLYAARAWRSLGRRERALALLEDPAAPRDPQIQALADSLRGLR